MRLLIAVAALLLLSQSGQVSSAENDHPASGSVHHHPHGETLTLRQNSSLDTMHQAPQNNAKEFPCPIAQEIAPCICSVDDALKLHLDCSAVLSDEQLASVFSVNFPVKDFNSFVIDQNNNISHLGNILNEVTFQIVSLTHVQHLEFMSDEFLLSSTGTLEELRVHNSALTRALFPFITLQLYSQLHTLSIRDSEKLTSIPKLTSNSITQIDTTFSAITSLEPGTFDAVPQLQNLYMSNNWISSLQPDSFIITNSHQYLSLYGNQLTAVEPGDFVVPEDSEPTSVALTIDLGSNSINRLDAGVFIMADRPQEIILYGNRLSSLEAGAFVLPQTTEYFSLVLDLSYNALTVLEEQVLGELFPYIIVLKADENPLACGCDIAWLVINPVYMAKIVDNPSCTDGRVFVELDPAWFEAFCY